MKFTISFKNTDTVHDTITAEVEHEVNQIEDLDQDEKQSLIEQRVEKVSDILDQWITYGEYVTIEFDTVAKTATVKKNK